MERRRRPPYASGMAERVLALDSPAYPELLRHIHEPPPLLHGRGVLFDRLAAGEALRAAVAVVGARDATAYGIAVARDLGRELARRGLLVVSGLALGIDGAAHRGALEAGGETLAVVGSGTDVVYPRAHAGLRQEILRRGAVVGELPCGAAALPPHFPRRNRIISGLSLGVVVVEATLRSGSLSTARHALEQGREVFAVPGAVTSPRSRGPHALLRAGAKLVETVEDVLSELPPEIRAGCGPAASPPPRCVGILRRLLDGPASADQLAADEGRQVSEIWADLLDLEIRGMISRGPGGRFCAAAGGAVVEAVPTSARVD